MRRPPGAEEGTAFDTGSLDVLGDGFRRREVDTFGFAAPAFDMESDRCFIAVLVEVGDVQLAAGLDAHSGIQIKFQDGAIADIEQRISRRHPHQLPRTGFREGAGFIDGVLPSVQSFPPELQFARAQLRKPISVFQLRVNDLPNRSVSATQPGLQWARSQAR
jgi:hypothetical protein